MPTALWRKLAAPPSTLVTSQSGQSAGTWLSRGRVLPSSVVHLNVLQNADPPWVPSAVPSQRVKEDNDCQKIDSDSRSTGPECIRPFIELSPDGFTGQRDESFSDSSFRSPPPITVNGVVIPQLPIRYFAHNIRQATISHHRSEDTRSYSRPDVIVNGVVIPNLQLDQN
jgi:hypothetical protein